MEDLDESLFEKMLYVMLPNGDTVLHRMAKSKNLLEKILFICHQDENGKINVKHYIPVLPNMEKKTAF